MLVFTVVAASAQCSSRNTAFKSGETLMYDLYFNWKFVWVKAGTAYMNITQSTYNGKPAYKTYLITRGSQKADRFFVMRDTLLSYCDLDLVPRYFRKGAYEGSTYRRNEVWYSYSGGESHVKMRYQRNNNAPSIKKLHSHYCAFDMISMLLINLFFNICNHSDGISHYTDILCVRDLFLIHRHRQRCQLIAQGFNSCYFQGDFVFTRFE